MAQDKALSIHFGTSTVRVKRYGSTMITVAHILGCDHDANGGIARIYVDRLVHTATDLPPEGWCLTGAITTVLEAPNGFQLPIGEVSGVDDSPRD